MRRDSGKGRAHRRLIRPIRRRPSLVRSRAARPLDRAARCQTVGPAWNLEINNNNNN